MGVTLADRHTCTDISGAVFGARLHIRRSTVHEFCVEGFFSLPFYPLPWACLRSAASGRCPAGARACQASNDNIVVGIIGAMVAGFLLTPLLGIGTINQNNLSLPGLFVSLLGAIILLAIVNLFRRSTVR